MLYPETVNFKCPICKSAIPFYVVKIGFRAWWVQEYFQCPTCETLLCVSAAYAWSAFGGTLVASVLITYTLGLSWLFFIPSAFIIWLLIVMVVQYIKVLIPPRIKQFYPDDLSLIRRS